MPDGRIILRGEAVEPYMLVEVKGVVMIKCVGVEMFVEEIQEFGPGGDNLGDSHEQRVSGGSEERG